VKFARLAASIDQTLLAPTIGFAEAAEWMERSRGAGFASLCVAPFLVPLAAQRLAGSDTVVCSVVGFPFGYSLTETKAEESVHLIELGCTEIDMVMNVGALLGGEEEFVRDDIRVVIAVWTSPGSGLVKVILEPAI
jgi:deoxyribose-phosphate aldolase